VKPRKKSFAQRVSAVVRDLRRGEVISYREVARRAGYPAAARAVGNVLANSVGLPWWRVVRADGRFAGHHPAEQAARLRREGVVVSDGRVVSMVARSGNFLTSVSPRVYSSQGRKATQR
jgi:methylated-DNA-protein-cysteine methyltransferase-like protein